MSTYSTYAGSSGGGLVGGETVSCDGNQYCLTSDSLSAIAVCFNQSACIFLPDATTIDTGAAKYTIKNISDSNNITVYDYCNRPFSIMLPCQSVQVSLYDNSDVCGRWIHEKPTTNQTGVGVSQNLDIVCTDFDLHSVVSIDSNHTVMYGYNCTSCVFSASVGKYDPTTSSYTFSTPCCVTTCSALQRYSNHRLMGTCADTDFAVVVTNRNGPQIVINKTGGVCLCCMPDSCTVYWAINGWGPKFDHMDRFTFLNPICNVTCCFEFSEGCVNLTTGNMCRYNFTCVCDCCLVCVSGTCCETFHINHHCFYTEACHFNGTVVCRILVNHFSPVCKNGHQNPSCYCGIATNSYIRVTVPTDGAATNDYCFFQSFNSLGNNCCWCYQCFSDCPWQQCVRSGRCIGLVFPGTACCFFLSTRLCNCSQGNSICCLVRSSHVNGTSASAYCAGQWFCCSQSGCDCRGDCVWPIADNWYYMNIYSGGDRRACLMYSASFNGSHNNCGSFELRCHNEIGCCGEKRANMFGQQSSGPGFVAGSKIVDGCYFRARICNTKYHDPTNAIIVTPYCSKYSKNNINGVNSWVKRNGTNSGCFIIPWDYRCDCCCVGFCVMCFSGSSVTHSCLTAPNYVSNLFCAAYFRPSSVSGVYEYLNTFAGTVGCFSNGSDICTVSLASSSVSSNDSFVAFNAGQTNLFERCCCYVMCLCRDANNDIVPGGVISSPSYSMGAATGVNTQCVRVTPASTACGSVITYQNACSAFPPTVTVSTLNCTDTALDNKKCFNLDTVPVCQPACNITGENGGYIVTNTTSCLRAFSFVTINP